MTAAKNTTLVLAAHGSEAAPNSNMPIHVLAKQIESRGLFARVKPAFLLGQPNMTNVLEGVEPGPVVVVPVMTSHGYYLKKVIPGKLAENPNQERFDWHLSEVAGMHPNIATLMIQRVRNRLQEFDTAESETTLLLVGHGTRRNRNSAKSTFALFEKLKMSFPQIRARVAFLDQDPELSLVAASIVSGHTLVVPFLVSRGPHMTEDVPRSIGLPSGADISLPLHKESGSRKTICEMPIGMYPEMADICVELAEQAILENRKLALPMEARA